MSTQKRKFELYSRLQALGFTYEEAVSLRRIEMTLQRWGEQECGDSNDYYSTSIERDEETGRPYRVVMYHDRKPSEAKRYPIADREAGAIKRLAAIIKARNEREFEGIALVSDPAKHPNYVFAYHQGDCRGCNLYLLTRSQLPNATDAEIEKHSGKHAVASETAKLDWALSVYYTRGLAVCA